MTVANQTNRIAAVGNAAIGQEVPFTFPITTTSDLLVKKRVTATGVETLLTETTNYTVVIADDIGGILTTVTAIELTEQIHIIRNTPKTQSLDLEQGGSFNAENIEDALDKSTKLAIENKDAIGKAIIFPATDAAGLTTELPNSIDRASKNLTFDASGNVAASVSVEEGSVSFTTFGTNMAEAANALAGKAVINLDHAIDVRDYGAVGDGSTDDTTAIQNAATAAAGSTLFFPKGTWLITSAITLDSDTMVRGTGFGSVIKTETLNINIFYADTKVRFIFKDFKIDGNRKGDAVSGNTGIANISLDSCADVLIENVYFLGAEYLSVRFNLGERHIVRSCIFDGAVAEGITAWGDFTIISNNHFVDCQYNAIVSRQSENITISGNTFDNIGFTAGDTTLHILPKHDDSNPGKNISIVGNVFHSNCYRPINVVGVVTAYIENVTISNNTFLDALGAHMIEVNYAKGVVISNNVCEAGATTRDIYIAIAEDVVIEGNICRNSVIGIQFHSLVDGIISNNLIDTASDSGIVVSGANDDRITVSGNRTKSCTNYGISVTNLANKLKVINNDDDSSGTPFAIAAVGAKILVYGNTIDGNLTVAKTADPTTLNIGECGLNITNSGAGAKVELDLPAATIGLRYTFTSLNANEIHIDPDGTETIRGGGAGEHLILNAAGETVTLECVVAGSWEIISYYAWGGDFEA